MAVVMTSGDVRDWSAYSGSATPGEYLNFRGGAWNRPRPKTKPQPGFEWYPLLNADGTRVIGWKQRPLGTAKGGAPGGSGGYGYGGGGGGGGGLSAYIQAYRMMFGDPKANPPKALLAKAKAGNWSTTYWAFMVRQQDPKYFRSAEAKKKMADLRTYMKAVGVGLGKGFAKRYLREGWSATQLQNELVGLKDFKAKYPHWAAFAKAQRVQGAAKQVNPLAYQAYQQTFRNAFQQAGNVIPEGWERTFFKRGITPDQFLENFSTLGQTQAAAQWDIGGLAPAQQKSVMFSGKGSAKVRTQLQQALAKQQQYFKQAGGTFGTQAEGDMLTLKGL